MLSIPSGLQSSAAGRSRVASTYVATVSPNAVATAGANAGSTADTTAAATNQGHLQIL